MTDADGRREKKKAIKHCFKDGNGALGGKLLLTVICRIGASHCHRLTIKGPLKGDRLLFVAGQEKENGSCVVRLLLVFSSEP